MPSYKAYDYDQLVMIPISLETQLEPGTLEYTINELIENKLDLSVFEGIDANIPDIQFRGRDGRFAEQQRFKKRIHPRKSASKPPEDKTKKFTNDDFYFDKSKQAYLCPHGKVLTCTAYGHRVRHRVHNIYRARQEDCALCPLSNKCSSKAQFQRRLVIPPESQPATLVDEMKAEIDTPQARQIYANRLAIVEPVFANIRIQKRLDRFTLRTKAKVDVQWRLFALAHNIVKTHTFWMGN